MVNIASETKENRIISIDPEEAWFIIIAAHTYLKYPLEMGKMMMSAGAIMLPDKKSAESLYEKTDAMIGVLPEELADDEVVHAD